MAALRELISHNPQAWLAWGGLLIGAVFGFIVYRTNFCTMGSLSDIVSFGDYRRFRAWLLASAVAIIGAQLLDAYSVTDISKSMYVGASLNWLGHALGGALFGYGMVFAGGCASRNLARAGGGDLRSLVTLLVMGLAAYMTIGGLFAPVRATAEQATAIGLSRFGFNSQSLGEAAGALLRLPHEEAGLIVGGAIAALLLVYCFSDRNFRASPMHILSGLGAGLCVVAGWALTGLAFDELADHATAPVSLTYVRPSGDTLEWLERFTAGMVPGFGVATVLGTVLGAFLAAILAGRFRLTSFSDVADTRRNLFGALLMGIGGVLALGCTVGQGITGVSTLAIGSFLTLAAIILGGVVGLKHLERILMSEA